MRLPVLTKSSIRENMEAIKSNDEYSKALIEVTSGGSTGDQATVFKSPYFNQLSRASVLRNNLLVGWMPYDKTVWIWGAPYEHEQLKGSVKARMGVLLNKRLLLNAFKYSRSDFDSWATKIEHYRPRILYGYAGILLDFSEYLLENSIIFKSIERVVSTTETLKHREVIEAAFNCSVYDQYGCREILSIGIESEKGVMRIADDVVALNFTASGEFLVTALHSYGFPLINYKLGDCGALVDMSPSLDDKIPFTCGRLTIGRITDNFVTSDNKIVSSSALGVYISTFNLAVLQQQIVQNGHKKFVVNYVPDKCLVDLEYQRVVKGVLIEYFGADLSITFNRTTEIQVEQSGKRLMFKRTFNY
jgi:phenylacetate-CoA ligase